LRLVCRPGDVQFKDMRSIVQNLQSGYRDQLAKLNLHVEIATKLNNRISAEKLSAIGNLEQDLVFGDATSKELIALINGNPVRPTPRKRRKRSWGAWMLRSDSMVRWTGLCSPASSSLMGTNERLICHPFL
jgi:hypothetical protein